MDSMNVLTAVVGLFVGVLAISVPGGIKIGKTIEKQQGHEARLKSHSDELKKLWDRLDKSLERIAQAELKNAETSAKIQGRMNTLEGQCTAHRSSGN